MPELYLSVIIPSYNEKKNLAQGVLDEVIAYLKKQTYSWEVILTDDGSNDGTAEALNTFAAKHTGVLVLHNPHRGKAATVTAGMMAAHGTWRLFTDFDQSTPISEVDKLLNATKYGAEIAVGSREGTGAQRENEPIYRHIMGRVFNVAVQILAVKGIKDTQNGFKLFSDRATQLLFPNLVIYGTTAVWQDAFTGAFDVELLFLARRHQLRIKEIPIKWKHRHTDRVSPLKDSFRMFRDVLRIRLAALQGKYGLAA